MPEMTRRDFLKTSAALTAGLALAGARTFLPPALSPGPDRPNIVILVFDAMSARHLSLYGYGRETTPNLENFAQRATVYHRHYAAGNFTTSGTASMLTGTYPWAHRALNYRGMVDRELADRNLFRLVGGDYTRLAFTQNLWADILLSQFRSEIDIHLPCDTYSRFVHSAVQPHDLPADRRMAYYVFPDFLNLRVDDPRPFPGSLLIASSDIARALASDRRHITAEHPRGLPSNYDFSYENRTVLDGVGRLVGDMLPGSAPFLSYVHLWSPHDPYCARREFVGRFDDELDLASKPQHPLSGSHHTEAELRTRRQEYDEFIADLDAEFGRLVANLETSGILQNSWVIVTSDHGELFERGELGHASALMYAPVTHIPLVIAAPGQTGRSDIHSLTSNVDLLPTILHLAGKEIPAWVEGSVLPGAGGAPDPGRGIFSIMAKDNPSFQPLRRASFVLLRGDYELLYYTGYPGHPDWFELYHLAEDPYELQNLFRRDITTASHMKEELLEAIDAADRNRQTK